MTFVFDEAWSVICAGVALYEPQEDYSKHCSWAFIAW